MLNHDLHSVLYVDDDPDICTVVEATLRAIGDLDVRTANSGERAIDLASDEQPDLILMDVMMPGLDGPSTLKLMRDRGLLADIPVIFLTAKVMPTEVSEFLRLGAIGVIGKPFDPTRLCGDIRALWGQTEGRTGRSSRARDVPGARTEATRTEEVAAQVTTLTGTFLERTRRDVRRLRGMLERLAAGDRSAPQELERLAHTIHGSGAMFGFPAISECGGMIEELAAGLAAELSLEEFARGAFEPQTLRQVSDWTDRLAGALDTEGSTLQSFTLDSASVRLRTVHH
jgi:two-component system OmpR family response regulator